VRYASSHQSQQHWLQNQPAGVLQPPCTSTHPNTAGAQSSSC
jgi:hypothetical protein